MSKHPSKSDWSDLSANFGGIKQHRSLYFWLRWAYKTERQLFIFNSHTEPSTLQPTYLTTGFSTFDGTKFTASSSMCSMRQDGCADMTESWYIVYFKNPNPRKCIVLADKWWNIKSLLFDLWQEWCQHQHPSQKHTVHPPEVKAGVRDVRGADGGEDRKTTEEVKVSMRRRKQEGGEGIGLHLKKRRRRWRRKACSSCTSMQNSQVHIFTRTPSRLQILITPY